ncbi:reverse transcriptase domain-containing protein [Tanacetum coccineum]
MDDEDEEKTAFYTDQFTQDVGSDAKPVRKVGSSKSLPIWVSQKYLPFFETLKNITKENKDGYRWTEDAKIACQELKKIVLNLLSLTTPVPKETLHIYLAVSQEAVSAVLLAEQKGKQCPMHYVSRILHEV